MNQAIKLMLSGVAVLLAASLTTGLAQITGTTAVTTTVATVNTMTVNTATLTFTPTVAVDDVDATTTIDYETNDGASHNLTVQAPIAGWTFTPAVVGSAASEYPLLRFVSSSTTGGGTVNTVAAPLITTADAQGAAANVLTAISNTLGTITVTLDVGISNAVTAGDYTTTLTYTYN